MPWGVAAAGIGAAASIYSASQGGNSNNQTSQASNAPWSVQQPFLTTGFNNASGIYGRQAGVPFQPMRYAGLNPTQTAAMGGLTGYASGAGARVASQLTSTGSAALNGVSQAGVNAGDIYNRTQGDPTQSIIASAGQYADNPFTKGMITAANTPIEQQLREQDLPAAQINAAGTGNTNSSREGMVEGILQRNAANQESNNAATIMGAQYNNGINTAAGLYGTNLAGSISANGQELASGAAGGSLLDQGYNTTMNNLNVPLQTGTLQQTNDQASNLNDYTNFNAGQQYPWTQENNYMGAVTGNYGGVSSGMIRQNPSMLSSALGGAGTGLGMYQIGSGMFNNNGGNNFLFGGNASSGGFLSGASGSMPTYLGADPYAGSTGLY